MASDSSSGFSFSFPTRGISHFTTTTQNTTDRVGEKERTNTDLGQLQALEREFCDTLHSLCICRQSWACTLREISTQSHLECQLIFDCLPSLPPSADRPSPGLLSHTDGSLLLSVVDCLSPSSLVNWPSVFPRTFLSSSTSGLVGDLELRPLCGFRAKADKEILWPARTHTHPTQWMAT